MSAGLRLGMERQGEDFPLRRVNDDVKVLEGVHAYLASAACSRHGEGKAVHLEVRPHAEGGGYAQLHDVAVPAVSVDVGGLGRELVSIWVRGPLFQRGQGKGRTGIKGQQEGVSSPGAADIENSGWVAFHFQRLHVLGGKAGAFQKLEGSIPDGQQERGEAQVVDSQNAVHPDLHIFLKGGEVHGEAEEVFNVKPSDGEGLHGEKLGNGVDVGAGGDLRVFKRQAGEILLDEFDVKRGVGGRRVHNEIAWNAVNGALRHKEVCCGRLSSAGRGSGP